jgi:hypothetical protein
MSNVWISTAQAQKIMEQTHGRIIRVTTINRLARDGHIRTRVYDGRTKLLHREDVEAYHIQAYQRKQHLQEA